MQMDWKCARLDSPGSGEPNVSDRQLHIDTALTSLEVAAQCGCEELFDILHTAGAEDSS